MELGGGRIIQSESILQALTMATEGGSPGNLKFLKMMNCVIQLRNNVQTNKLIQFI